MLTQHGGWPMSVFLTPEASRSSPAPTFPPATGSAARASVSAASSRSWIASGGRSGPRASQSANRSRKPCSRASPRTPQPVAGASRPARRDPLHAEGSTRARAACAARRSPLQHNVRFLLRYWKRTGDEQALRRRKLTLEKMALAASTIRWGRLPPLLHRRAVAGPHFEKSSTTMPCRQSPTSKAGGDASPVLSPVAVETLDAGAAR